MIRRILTLALVAPAALAATARASLVVDTLETAQTVQLPAGGTGSTFASVAAPEALGGEREVHVQRSSGNDAILVLVNPSGTDEQLSLSSPPSTGGTLTLVWDGPDGNAAVDADGLGGIDLTEAGANDGFLVTLGSDLPATLQLTVTGASGGTATASLPVAGGGALQDVFVPFEAFDVSGPLAEAGSVSLAVFGSPGADLLIDDVTVPEPAGGAAAGIATLFLLACRRHAARNRR